MGDRRKIHIKWVHTSDTHANLFGRDCMSSTRSTGGGLSDVCSYIRALKKEYNDQLIVTDGGDCLQGQPLAYYYNFIDTESPHLVAEVMNEMEYVCGVMGNHDIEVGETTFERWMGDCNFPILGANVIDKRTSKPYLKPYIVLHREGIKIVILGMVTPMVKYYLPNTLWQNLEFEEIVPSVKRWVNIIQKKEQPDLMVGLFHSGYEGLFDVEGVCQENAVKMVAEKIPGFDLICYGHDHVPIVQRVKNNANQEVVCIGSAGAYFTEANIEVIMQDDKVVHKEIDAKLLHAGTDFKISHKTNRAIRKKYDLKILAVEKWLNSPICQIADPLQEKEAFFGPCQFMNLIHQTQMEMTGAKISIAAPYSYNKYIKNGVVHVKDILLLSYEDLVYKIRLNGGEIKSMLELSYSKWCNRMQSKQDHCLNIYNRNKDASFNQKAKRIIKRIFFDRENNYNWRLSCPYRALHSAEGLIYTVDVTKPVGNRVNIVSLADGAPFAPGNSYYVAINRGALFNIDGSDMTSVGAGLNQEDIPQRVISISELALPFCILHKMSSQKRLIPEKICNWKFIPEGLVSKVIERDRKLLFPSNLIHEMQNSCKK